MVGMVRILVIDNYDSFVYNVVNYLAHIGADEDLSAVVPIGLVAVVFLGVVAGGEDDTALATEMTDGK